MKRIAFILLLLLATAQVYAQKELLVLNEQNKLTYYQVKNVPAALPATLIKQAASFLKKNYQAVKLEPTSTADSSLAGKGKIVLYKKAMLSGQEDGEVNYSLRLDFKNNRYRVLLTNFVYTPYKRTRFGTFAPVSGITIPLDKPDSSLSSKQLDIYLNQIAAYCAAMDKQLNTYLQNPDVVKESQPATRKVKYN